MRSTAFTCCSGCDALPTPVGNRLCVSRRLEFPVDAVLTGEWDTSSVVAACAALHKSMPCLRRIFVPPSTLGTAHGEAAALPTGVDETGLHLVEGLSESFIVVPADACKLLSESLLPADFFTPNGIPLLFAAAGGSAEAPNFLHGPAGRTKSLNAIFAEVCAADPALTAQCSTVGYTPVFTRWAYAERHGILAPSPFTA